jgi:O-methyltransferase involved in polyketide biosynthesis
MRKSRFSIRNKPKSRLQEAKKLEIDYSKISVTAKLVAFFRKFSDIPFAVDVAEYIHADETLMTIGRHLEDGTDQQPSNGSLPDEGKIYAPILEARYKSIVELILKSGYNQVLELASGFSLRGLAMSSERDFVYVESDLQGINDEKQKLIPDMQTKYSIADNGKHHIATANALAFDELERAIEPLSKDQPLIVANEGLIPYLTADERKTLASNVHKLLHKFAGGGIWITPDFTTRQVAENVSEKVKRFRAAIAGATDRPLYASAFETDEEIDQFIKDSGFDSQCVYQIDEVPHLSSCERLGINPQVIEHLKPRMRIWQLSPR